LLKICRPGYDDGLLVTHVVLVGRLADPLRSSVALLQQNFIDTAVNEWRKRLIAFVRIVGHHFKQLYYRQLTNGQLDEMSAKVSEMRTKCVLRVKLIKQSTHWIKSDIALVAFFPGSAKTNVR